MPGQRGLTTEERFWSKVNIGGDDECWEWQASKRNGYGAFDWSGGKVIDAHRVAYLLAKGPIPLGMFVTHSCDNKSCVNPAHLRTGTNADNLREAVERHGLNSGKNSPNTKLTEADVRTMRLVWSQGKTSLRELAVRFGMSKGGVHGIVTGKRWSLFDDDVKALEKQPGLF